MVHGKAAKVAALLSGLGLMLAHAVNYMGGAETRLLSEYSASSSDRSALLARSLCGVMAGASAKRPAKPGLPHLKAGDSQ